MRTTCAVLQGNYPASPDSSIVAELLEADLNRKHFHWFGAEVWVCDDLNLISFVLNVDPFALVITIWIAAGNDQAVKVATCKTRPQSLYPVAVNEAVFLHLFPTLHGVKVFPLNG